MKIPLTFRWSYLQGDRAEYMQRSVELEPVDVWVAVELEADPKFFHNQEASDYAQAMRVYEVSGGDRPKFSTPEKIMLTPSGVAEARKLVNEALAPLQHPYAQNAHPMSKELDPEAEDADEVDPENW